jgi:serine/threonine protein kinase
MIIEYLEGGELLKKLKSLKALKEKDAVIIIKQSAEALYYMHS